MVKNDVSVAYDILVKVYRDGTYLNLIMKEIANKRVTKIVYGVLDHHYELNYIVNYLAHGNETEKDHVRPGNGAAPGAEESGILLAGP